MSLVKLSLGFIKFSIGLLGVFRDESSVMTVRAVFDSENSRQSAVELVDTRSTSNFFFNCCMNIEYIH